MDVRMLWHKESRTWYFINLITIAALLQNEMSTHSRENSDCSEKPVGSEVFTFLKVDSNQVNSDDSQDN